MLRLMETEAASHVSNIQAGTYMNTSEQIDAWQKIGGGLRSVIQAYGSHAIYDPAYQGAYQPPQQPHAYYGRPGKIVGHAVCRDFF